MKPWLFVGAKVVCVKKGPWRNDITSALWDDATDPRNGEVCIVTEVLTRDDAVGIRIAGRASPYNAKHFRPVSTIDTTKTVEALRKLTLDARRKVDA